MEREVGGGIGMGNTCKRMADSFRCMTKSTTIKRLIIIKYLEKKKRGQVKSIKCLRKRKMGHRSEKGVQTGREVEVIQTHKLLSVYESTFLPTLLIKYLTSLTFQQTSKSTSQ